MAIPQLNANDVERLARTSSPKARADVAGKVAQSFSDGTLSGREKDVAIEIFRLLVTDAEVRVRRALSGHLSKCMDIPREVALSLAHDVGEVSTPMLEFSRLLNDEDLMEIIGKASESICLEAVARREYVGEDVSEALLASRRVPVVIALLGNRGAEIAEQSILQTITEMAENESVMDAMLQRGTLPVACIETIFLTVADHMKKRLIERHQLSRHLLEGKIEYAREWATLGVTNTSDDGDVKILVRHMHEHRRLTSSVVIRSLCVGDFRFFEHALSQLTDVPVKNVRKLMRDAGPLGFSTLYKSTPLPPTYYEAVRKLLDIALEETGNGKVTPDDFCERVVDKITADGYDLSIESMPLLLAIIKGNASDFSTIH